MTTRFFKFWLLLVVVTLSIVVGTGGTAQAAEPSAADLQIARRLFQRATADEELGRWEPALKTLREVEAIKATAGVLFHIAVCEQNLGRYVEALNDLGRAEELAQVHGDDSVLELIPDRRREIESKVAHLRIELLGPTADAEVRIDGQRVSAAALKQDIPLNPREHTIAVLQQGKLTSTRTLTLQSGSRHTERFELTAPPAVTAQYAVGQPEAPSEQRHPSVARDVVMYSAYALALGGAGAGIYFVVDANNNSDNAALARSAINERAGALGLETTNACVPPYAGSDDLQKSCVVLQGALDNQSRSQALAIGAFTLAGLGALGGTAVLLFWHSPENETALRIVPTLNGALISGRF